MFANMNGTEYIESLGKQKDTSEVDVVLMTLLLGVQLQIYYFDGTGLAKLEFSPSAGKEVVRLYLNPNGVFDVVYDKGKIKVAGICQAIVLDVSARNS